MTKIELEQILEIIEAIWTACQALKDDMVHVKDAVSDLVEACLDDGASGVTHSSAGSWLAGKDEPSDDDFMDDEEKQE